jgi:hypothetical protein
MHAYHNCREEKMQMGKLVETLKVELQKQYDKYKRDMKGALQAGGQVCLCIHPSIRPSVHPCMPRRCFGSSACMIIWIFMCWRCTATPGTFRSWTLNG